MKHDEQPVGIAVLGKDYAGSVVRKVDGRIQRSRGRPRK